MPTPLTIVAHEFRRHRDLAERAIAELDDHAFFARPAPAVNPIAVIVKHLAGNLRSRWSDFLASDGDKPDRHRDGEFRLDPADTREALMAAWSRGWSTLEGTLRTLRPDDLDRTVTIRGEPHLVAEALLRGATHAAYHVGQILYVARLMRPDAPYLTVAPGASGAIRPGYLASGPTPHRRDTPRLRRLLEAAVYVDDLPRAVRFYGEVLGLRLMGESERVASFDAGGGTVLLVFRRGASLAGVPTEGGRIPGHDGTGPAHLAFAVDATALDLWKARLGAEGVAIESEVGWPRGGRSIYVRDPDGHSIELATPGVWEIY